MTTDRIMESHSSTLGGLIHDDAIDSRTMSVVRTAVLSQLVQHSTNGESISTQETLHLKGKVSLYNYLVVNHKLCTKESTIMYACMENHTVNSSSGILVATLSFL